MRRSGFARQPVPNSTIRPALFRHPMHSMWRVRSLSGKENELLRTCFAVWRASGWGFSEYLAVREDNLVPLPDEVSDSAGALVECFAIGAHAVRRAEIKAEQNVLVIGAGPIGLATAAIARAKGAHVVVADIDCQRRQHVVDHLAINVFDPTQEGFIAALSEVFGGELACVVLDATGNKASMSHDVNLIRHGGKIVFIGLYIENLLLTIRPSIKKRQRYSAAAMPHGKILRW